MIRTLTLIFAVALVSVVGSKENDVDTQRYLKNDKELSSLRGKFGLFFEPDERRGESRTAFQHILTFLNKRPAATKPTAGQNVCGESDSSSEWNNGDGYSAKSLLPAIIGSMKEDALYNIF